MEKQVFEAVDQYISQLLAPEDDALRAIDPSLSEAGMPPISVSANQGQLLQLLARLVNARRILEIGTLGGYSTIWLARALPSDGTLITLEVDAHHAGVARSNIDRAGLSAIVEVRIGKALDLLPQLAGEAPFDLIFIDADKPPYADYFDWAVKLSRVGTLIVADNVIREGKVLDPDSDDERVRGVQRFNALLATRTDVTATILQTVGLKGYDGMALAVVTETPY